MNIKIKTTLIIVLTLLIGILTGAMLNRTLTHRRIRNILLQRRPDVFATRWERHLRPNTGQERAIREILDKHARKIADLRLKFLEEMQSQYESLKKEIDPLLTPKQKRRLMRGFPRHSRDPRRLMDRRRPRQKPKRKRPRRKENFFPK